MTRLTSMRFLVASLFALLSPLALTANQALAAVPALPLPISEEAWRPLSAYEDSSLEGRLAQALKRDPLWESLISEEKMAVGVVDFSDTDAPRFAQVNGETMMYAGSLAKLAILLSAFHGFEDGTLVESAENHKDLTEMIRLSDNPAANRMIERIGLRKIEAVMRDLRYKFYDRAKGGGLWLGRCYANRGEINPDPLKGLVHAATVTQVCRFYYMLTTGRIISRERCRQMLEVLSSPQLHDKFVGAMERTVPREHLYRKSGTWRIWHADSVLVWDETGGKYILTAMVEHENGEGILRQLVPLIRRLLNIQNRGALGCLMPATADYSCRKASMGSRRAALRAGK